MTDVSIRFAPLTLPHAGTAVIFADASEPLGGMVSELDKASGGALSRALKTARFKGKAGSVVELLAPANLAIDRLLIAGSRPSGDGSDTDALRLGGSVMARLGKGSGECTILLEGPLGAAGSAAEIALGLMLRAYSFDTYKTGKNADSADGDDSDNGNGNGNGNDNGSDGDAASGSFVLTLGVADPAAAEAAWADRKAVAEGVILARNLVNEPANILGPEEFAAHAQELSRLGVEVEILTEREMTALGMNALLAVGVGSERPSRLAVMAWKGGGDEAPVGFVGKGVVFDTGGISIKPAAGMEDMKGDMAGAACVVGLMHTLAARKAAVNAVGMIGLVENMPDGKATRPGDIITAMSGKTIEVINTDAEGRLVLADVLHYMVERYQPMAMIDLATLTGACMVALGQEYAGLFSNNDELAIQLGAAGDSTGERLWRMPLAKAYDKLIDSRFADMKNTGGRWAGAITAAQFLKRFVGDTPWAHLDIAGTGMDSRKNEINQSWGGGFGVRLLDRYVRDVFENRA